MTGDVQKRFNEYCLQWRFPLHVPDTLAGLHEVSFEGLFRDGAVFGGIGEGESGPGIKVSSMYGCKPRGIDRKTCCSMKVADEGSNSG